MLSSVMIAGHLGWRAMAGCGAVGAEPIVTAIESLRLGAELFNNVSLVESSTGVLCVGGPDPEEGREVGFRVGYVQSSIC